MKESGHCKIVKDYEDQSKKARPGINRTVFPVVFDKPLKKGTEITLGEGTIFTSTVHEVAKLRNSEFLHYCEFFGDEYDYIKPELVKAEVVCSYTWEEEISENECQNDADTAEYKFPRSVTYTREMSPEDIVKEYGEHFTEEQIERLADLTLKNSRSIEEDRKAFAEGILYGYKDFPVLGGPDAIKQGPRFKMHYPVQKEDCFKVIKTLWGSYVDYGENFFIPESYKKQRMLEKFKVAGSKFREKLKSVSPEVLSVTKYPSLQESMDTFLNSVGSKHKMIRMTIEAPEGSLIVPPDMQIEWATKVLFGPNYKSEKAERKAKKLLKKLLKLHS